MCLSETAQLLRAERPEGEPEGSPSFSWPPGHPEALSHHSPSLLRAPLPSQASPLLGLLCPQRISSALRTQRPGTGHVSQCRASAWPLNSRLKGPATCLTWSHGVSLGLKKWWQKQTTIPPIPPPTSAITLPPRPHTPGRSALTWRPLVPPLEPPSTCLHHPCGLSHFSPPANHPGPLVRWPRQPPHCLSASSTLHPWSSLPSSHSSQRDASRESGHDTVSLKSCKGFLLYLGLNLPTCHLTRDPKAYVRAPLHPSVTSLGFLCSPPAWPPCKP